MPWQQEPMKDVTSCDKLRVGAHSRKTADFRMGKPAYSNVYAPAPEQNRAGGGNPVN